MFNNSMFDNSINGALCLYTFAREVVFVANRKGGVRPCACYGMP